MQYSSSQSHSSYSSRRDEPSWISKDQRDLVPQSAQTGKIYLCSKQTVNDNCTQLDALLADLKNERERQTENEHYSTITRTTDRKIRNTHGTVPRPENYQPSMKTESHEFENVITSGSPSSVLSLDNYRQRNTFRNEIKSNKYKLESSNIYDDRSTLNESSSYSKTKVIPIAVPASEGHLEQNLSNIVVTDDILPRAGTKVTTTVRTYTYEIPSGVSSNLINNSQHSYNINATQISEINKKDSTLSNIQIPVHQTTKWNTKNEEYNNNKHEFTDGLTKTYQHEILRERNINTIGSDTSTTERTILRPEAPRYGYQPNGPTNLKGNYYCPLCRTTVYNSKINNHICEQYSESYESPMLNNNSENYNPNMLPYTLNTPRNQPQNEYIIRNPTLSTPTSHSQMYSSTKLYTHNEHLKPFPVDGGDYPDSNVPTADRPNDLLPPFGIDNRIEKTVSPNAYQKKEIETAVATEGQGKNAAIKKAGPEVYYPPKYEMSTEKWQGEYKAGGQWAKGSGSAEYSSGSKYKTKSKSGGAIVPVCLPLCCAMPCTIM